MCSRQYSAVVFKLGSMKEFSGDREAPSKKTT